MVVLCMYVCMVTNVIKIHYKKVVFVMNECSSSFNHFAFKN